MTVKVLGLNHKTAPVALREKVAFNEDRLVAALRTLRAEKGVAEVLILSTCNRTELYWSGHASGEEISDWLARHHGGLELAPSLYVHQDRQAVEHAFSVASGLDSMVLGEAQILGQLKEAYRIAQSTGSTGPWLHRLFQAAFAVAKRVRSETRIGANAVSLASATVSLARRVYSDLSAHTALMIGAGEMIALTARHFASAGVKRMVIANRTLSRAQTLAAEVQAYAVELAALDKELIQADIVVSCTASSIPLVTKAATAAALRRRRHRPIFMVDLAVPRDIEPAVSELQDVYLFTIDDLEQLIAQNRKERALAADDARVLLEEEVARFLTEARAHDAGPAIRALREHAAHVREHTIEEARRMLTAGKPPAEVLDYLAHTLTNRLLHAPTQALRHAAESDDPTLASELTRLLIEARSR
jgi:glutamyl-tRNA reductase